MIGNNIISFKELSSTNTYLKNHYNRLPHGTVITAEHQTGGRGRFDRSWFAGDDLMFSILIKEDIPCDRVYKIGSLTAAALHQVIHQYCPNTLIKWPNDIIANNKKIAGILLETIFAGENLLCLIVGIGINVNTLKYPEELVEKAISLRQITNSYMELNSLMSEVLEVINTYFLAFLQDDDSYMDVCIEYSNLIGKKVLFNNFRNKISGQVITINNNGNIVIDVAGEIKEFNSGEITLLSY